MPASTPKILHRRTLELPPIATNQSTETDALASLDPSEKVQSLEERARGTVIEHNADDQASRKDVDVQAWLACNGLTLAELELPWPLVPGPS